MSIKYLCPDCAAYLKMSGPPARNEVGRKSCESCGDNQDNLIVVGADECDRAIEEKLAQKPRKRM